jgi:hypothetical protein
VRLGGVGNYLRQRGLARPRRTPENDRRKQSVSFDGPAQQFAGAEDVLLTDLFVQRARAHPGGEGGFAFHAVVHGVGEEVL